MTMEHKEEWTEQDRISMRLQEDGVPPQATAEERQQHLWQQLHKTEAELQSATQELQTLQRQQTNETKEMESYVAHIRGMLEERECLSAEYERDNEHLRHELHHIKHQQEIQSKELAEMLAQEDLGEIGLSNASEQVAYLLVERTTLLERLEAAERRLESQSLSGNMRDHSDQVHIRQQMGEELRLHREEVKENMDGMTKAHNEQVFIERNERLRLERDLDEASCRLAMAHQDIRRLTNELDAAKNNILDQSEKQHDLLKISGLELQGTVDEVDNLKKEVDKLRYCDMINLQRAKEQNDRLEAENRALKERVRIESEKKNLVEKMTRNGATTEDKRDMTTSNASQGDQSDASAQGEQDHIHKKCHEALEDGLVQVRDLQRQLQRLRKEQEELEERNEELEALLGEAQNASKEERHRHEGEVEGLLRRIKSLEGELKKYDAQEKKLRNGEEVKTTESILQSHLRDSSQERLALLEARLTEEKDWRKQLELDLCTAQGTLKKYRETLQLGERELKKLRFQVDSLQTECQQGRTLIKSLTQVKGENAILEEKVAQIERAHSRVQKELEGYKSSNHAQEDLRGNRLQVTLLQEKADRLTAEISSLQTAHNTLRDEMASERQQTAELHTKLSACVQEKLAAEGAQERLELEIQRLNKLIQLHQEQLSTAKEVSSSSPRPELHTAHAESRLSPVEKIKEESLGQLSVLQEELNHLQNKLLKEQNLASRHQMALQAQVNEAQAHVKSQDSVLNQKAEEAKQMKQDLQRVQNLFNSAEKELRYEKEKNLDLKKHNTLLEQEKLKLCAELKQIQNKLVPVEQKVQTQEAKCERQQQKIRELELELARSGTNRNTTTSLQEDLQAERAKLIDADKKVLELQLQLKNAQHQLRVEEARASESSRLERDSRDLSHSLSALQAQQQEEHITRKLLEQREEELQQQVRTLRLKEASLNRTNTELTHRVQQLDTRVSITDTELGKAREEAKESQRSNNTVQETLMGSQQECERLQAELQQVLLQLDAQARKHNEKHSQHKIKMHQVKQLFMRTTAQRDGIIQKLENDLALAISLSHKEKERIRTVLEENEKLLVEKRELLQKISDAEDMGSKGMRTASTIQHRVNVLEVENRQLQERTLKLSNQVGCLERALRNVQSFYSLENLKKVLPENVSEGILQTSTLSVTSRACDPMDLLGALCRAKVCERVATSFPTQLPSEQGYLNVTCPSVCPVYPKCTEENSNPIDQSPEGDQLDRIAS